jgi:pimeloyl-ACP methyl ester carboxylesterase
MKELIEKTSHPLPAPKSYVETGERYAQPAILKAALTETSGRGPSILSALDALKQRKLPILLLWGKQDQVSAEDLQIEPLRKLFPDIRERALDPAGHALLWTHPERLAQEIANFIGGTV